MKKSYTLVFWPSDIGFVGIIREIPGVFGYGKTLEELEKNIHDAYKLLIKSQPKFESIRTVKTKIITFGLR